jgi:hypothetical protein
MNLNVLGRKLNRHKSNVVRTFTVIILTLVLSSTSIPITSYASMSNPPPLGIMS